MKKYLMISETDEDKIGDVDGIQCRLDDSVEADIFLNHTIHTPLDFELVNFFILDNKAIVTDLLSVGNRKSKGLLISERMFNAIRDCKTVSTHFIPVYIPFKQEQLKYFWLDFFGDFTDKINYERTGFQVKLDSFPSPIYEELLVKNDRNDIIEFYKTIAGTRRSIVPKDKYVFNMDVDALDFFRIGQFDMKFYLSERLKNILEKEKFTGFYFVESTYF